MMIGDEGTTTDPPEGWYLPDFADGAWAESERTEERPRFADPDIPALDPAPAGEILIRQPFSLRRPLRKMQKVLLRVEGAGTLLAAYVNGTQLAMPSDATGTFRAEMDVPCEILVIGKREKNLVAIRFRGLIAPPAPPLRFELLLSRPVSKGRLRPAPKE